MELADLKIDKRRMISLAKGIEKEIRNRTGIGGMTIYFILWRLKEIWDRENAP